MTTKSKVKRKSQSKRQRDSIRRQSKKVGTVVVESREKFEATRTAPQNIKIKKNIFKMPTSFEELEKLETK